MARNLKLLLTETVDSLGIVGDVVNVRIGYARNFLLPRRLATQPSDEAIKALASKRADAERMIAEQRTRRTEIAKKLEGFELSLVRSCNDQGILYGAVTQQEISKALHEKGYEVRPRDVRLPHAIKRVDNYEVHIKFEADLEAIIKLHVIPDRKLELEDQRAEEAAPAPAAGAAPEAAGAEHAAEPRTERGKKGTKGEDKRVAPKPEESKPVKWENKKGKSEEPAAGAPAASAEGGKEKKAKKADKQKKEKE
jgi:large subunit ribosomal protein L9